MFKLADNIPAFTRKGKLKYTHTNVYLPRENGKTVKRGQKTPHTWTHQVYLPVNADLKKTILTGLGEISKTSERENCSRSIIAMTWKLTKETTTLTFENQKVLKIKFQWHHKNSQVQKQKGLKWKLQCQKWNSHEPRNQNEHLTMGLGGRSG